MINYYYIYIKKYIINERIITNSHHICKGIVLILKNSKVEWNVNWEDQKNKYGIFQKYSPAVSRKDGILDPVNSLDDFIVLINLMFEFTFICVDFIK